ncbi:MAG: efflux RND transporter permease subunit [Proteobacteria bacterium]|nr:efflux RND transporter permease subunit [Pseudomonadota bacterium]
MRLSHFFIERPIFAAAVSVVITLVGLISYFSLPVDQYPNIAPPTVTVSAMFPGATAEEIAETVAAPLEQQINGITGMLYMSSSSTGEGRMTISVTFKTGINVDIAQVEVQNRIQSVLPQLPQEVRDLGLTVRKGSTETLLIVHMFASDPSVDRKYIANYASLQVRERLLRTPGVGDVTTNAARDYAMRVWIDPERAAARDLTVQEIVTALRNSNMQVAGGAIGAPPFNNEPAAYQLNVRAQGRLESPEQFADAIIKRDAQGRVTRIGDVARVELGAQNYALNAYKSQEPAVSLSVMQAPNSNALEAEDNIRRTMEELRREFPPGVAYEIIFNPVSFTRLAVEEVRRTLLEAMLLGAVVVLLFLQRWRTALIPLVAIPVSLVGSLAVMSAFGFSLNNLSMFALVLSIGIVVDDAIVVVENVERHLRAGMAPREAARLTMDEVGGALIGIALVLVAVFVPTAFMGGITGQFYKQFALTIAAATVISLIVSLTLSPAMAAVLLKPHDPAEARTGAGRRLFAWGEAMNAWMDRMALGYSRLTAVVLRRSVLMLVLYAGLVGITAWRVVDTPRGFVPVQDQANVAISVTMPPGSSLARTDAIVQRIIPIVLDTPGVSSASVYSGMDGITFSPSTSSGQMWAILKPFEERLEQGLTAQAIATEIRKRLAPISAAEVRVVMPAPVRGLGSTGGFRLMVEDRAGLGYRALESAVQGLAEAASKEKAIGNAFSNFNTRNPTLDAVVDRDKAEMLGVPVRNVFATLQTYLAGSYVNNISLLGHTFQVIAQGDTSYRQDQAWVGNLKTRSASGAMVPISALAEFKPATAPYRVMRYNLYPAADIQGEAAPGYSSGEALAAMERLARENLPAGMHFEWTDMAYQQQIAGGSGDFAFVLGVLFVFIFLAALYESITLPLAVILIVPMCLLAAILGVNALNLDNNILTQIGMVVLVGLAAKNAILIVEFARQGEAERGLDPVAAAVEAARTRLRPILMTSVAFICGVAPLAFAVGAGAELRRALGVAVFYGMIGVTLFGLVFTPVFYVLCRRMAGRFTKVPHIRLLGEEAQRKE